MSEEIPFNGINNVVFLKLLLCDQLKCKKEELDFKMVTSFSLEHRSLMKINCLWPLSNLKKLNLSSNTIKRIENLDSLTQLEDLDLSFNEISKIENLHTLTKLRRFSLYANRIEVLENMESLKNLKIFNVGANCITDKTCPFYLAQFKNLRCVILSENPCYADPTNEIDDYLLALMPQLLDLNNRKVTEKDRYLATTHYKMKNKGLKKFAVGKVDTLRSKHSKKQENKIITAADRLYQDLFVEYKNILQLEEEAEVFKTCNHKFKKRMIDFFQQAYSCGDHLRKKFDNHKKVHDELEAESIGAQKRFICHVGISLHSEEINKKRALQQLRMTLLAEECDTQHRFEKLLEDLKNKLRTESVQQIERLKEICVYLKKEIDSYVETIFKSISNQFCNKKAEDGEQVFWNEVDLDEYESNFKQHCTNCIDNLESTIMRELLEWGKEFTDTFQSNLLRHRKAVAGIIKAVQVMNVD